MASKKNPGLPSLNESRATRHRQVTTGKTAIGGIPPRLFLAGLLVLLVGGFIYFRHAQTELEEHRGRILAKQRAVATVLGPKLLPLRDKIEAAIEELAQAPSDEQFVNRDVNFQELLVEPGLYLRLRLEDAKDMEKARKAALSSLRDGFTSCFMRGNAPTPTTGEQCEASKDCEPGELCNEFDVCQLPSSPYNMRLLYRALGVLSEKWTQEVRDAGTELALVAYERGLDSVSEVDVPVAIEVYQRAKYVVIVLDEPPSGELPEALEEDEFETKMERLQRTAHRARVGVWSLPDGQLLAMLQGNASGELRDVGTRQTTPSPLARAARARQANSCALAMDVKGQLLSAARSEQESPDGSAASPSDQDVDSAVDP